MEKEISSGAMLGIVLIALAAIIGLGFGVFAIAKGTANEGVTGVQENLQSVSQSAYTDYDQKIVTGTQVVSAYNNFEGKNVAILVATQATKDATTDAVLSAANVVDGGGAGVGAAYKNQGKELPYVKAFTFADGKVSDTEYKTTRSDNSDVQLAFVNYNALIAGAQLETSGSKADQSAVKDQGFGTIGFDTNCWKTAAGFANNAGKVLFNNISTNLNKTGMMEYVPSGTRFQSYLIKDLSGTTVGVAFEQIGASK